MYRLITFYRNMTICGGVMTSYRYFKMCMGHRVANLLPISGLVTAIDLRNQNVFVYQILMTYLDLRIRYYYFLFMITNGQILLYVLIL